MSPEPAGGPPGARRPAALLEIVRGLARELHPPELADLGLGPALRAFGRSLSREAGMEVEVEHGPRAGEGLGREARVDLYRTARDLLRSAARSDGSGPVRLRLRVDEGRTLLEVERSGPGAGNGSWGERPPPGASPEATGTPPRRRRGTAGALRAVRERVGRLGGRVVADGPEGGFRVRVAIPSGGCDTPPVDAA